MEGEAIYQNTSLKNHNRIQPYTLVLWTNWAEIFLLGEVTIISIKELEVAVRGISTEPPTAELKTKIGGKISALAKA